LHPKKKVNGKAAYRIWSPEAAGNTIEAANTLLALLTSAVFAGAGKDDLSSEVLIHLQKHSLKKTPQPVS